jgi:thiamine transport system substrate-binding protein
MKQKITSVLLLALVMSLTLSACKTQPSTTVETATLTIMTHDSFAASEGVIAAFEQENNVKLVFVKSGDAGSTLNRAILTKESPQADVLYGVDNTLLSRALDEGIYEAYDSPLLTNIPAEFQLDSTHNALPVDYGDVCINYDKAYFAEHALAVPKTLADLTDPVYNGLLVVENPATSSTGLAFLLATIAEYSEDGYLDYWQQLKDNGLVIVNDWSTAYYTNFSASSGKGAQPMVLSYASSPPVEVIYAAEPPADAPTASLVGRNMCFRQIEFVGILKSTPNRALAEKFIDYMLSQKFQEDMPLQMFMYPVNPEAELPEVFVKYSQIPAEPAVLDPEVIAANRDQWLNEWTEAILR